MKTSREYLEKKKPDLLAKLQSNRLSTEVKEAMEDYALDFAGSVLPNDNLPKLVREMRRNQVKYFATRSKGALIVSKELEKEVDLMLKAL